MRRPFRRKQKNNKQDASAAATRSLPDIPHPLDHPTHMSDLLSAQAVASLPPPGLSGPTQLVWSPGSSRYLAFVSSTAQTARQLVSPPALYPPLTTSHATSSSSSTSLVTTSTTTERTLLVLDLQQQQQQQPTTSPELRPLLRLEDVLRTVSGSPSTTAASTTNNNKRSLEQNTSNADESLEERLRRERQRLSWGSSLTQFGWAWTQTPCQSNNNNSNASRSISNHPILRVLVPVRGSLYIQDGIDHTSSSSSNDSARTPLSTTRCLHDKSLVDDTSAVDPQLSPDASMVAWTCSGEVFCKSATAKAMDPAIRITYGAIKSETISISHGIADFVAQEEMDRYRGVWWNPNSQGLLIARVDESPVPLFRIVHYPSGVHAASGVPTAAVPTDAAASAAAGVAQFEDHRYPFAGMRNPTTRLAYVKIDTHSVHGQRHGGNMTDNDQTAIQESASPYSADAAAIRNWATAAWFDPPREASEYLARVYWLPDGTAAISQWQNRAQNVTVLYRMDLETGKGRTLLIQRSDDWINLHHMFVVLDRPIHPEECALDAVIERNLPVLQQPLPPGSFSFLFASERTKYMHVYLYTYVPGMNGDQAIFLRAISSGDWEVENIVGVDLEKDTVYVTGTYDSVLERHLYALPLTNRASLSQFADETMQQEDHHNNMLIHSPTNGMRKGINKVMNVFGGGKHSKNDSRVADEKGGQGRPIRLTEASGMHSIVMDDLCQYFVDNNSDLDRPTTVRVYKLPECGINFSSEASQKDACVVFKSLFEAEKDDKALSLIPSANRPTSVPLSMTSALPAPEIISFPTSDGAETLYAALYRPDPRVHGPGPYPLICAVYGGPHVQRVNRSWSQSADMRAQRLRNLGFCVVKCDNRGSSRRGVAFERAISRQLGRVEVLDQVTAVRQLIMRGIADATRVGVYGWSYGGYLATMCLFRAPDVFHVAVAGAPVTSWDGYDTHYTERYMGHPSENPSGYRESAVFDHVPNMRGKLMLVHGLIDENVHFRHTSRLINKLTNAGKEYELLVFPDERHSPRRLRDRVYMEQRISDFFVRNLSSAAASQVDIVDVLSQSGGLKRHMVGHL